MRKALFGICSIFFLIFSLQIIFAQPQEEKSIVDKEKIERSIAMFERIYNKEIAATDLSYILENISSTSLMSIITDWESSRDIYIEENTMLILLVNLLNSEIKFINCEYPKEKLIEARPKALISYLDSIEKSPFVDPMSVKILEQMGIGPILASSEPIVFGRIYISSNPNKADVYFNGNKRGQTNNKWVLVTGEYSLTLKKKNYHTYNTRIKIEEGENSSIHHTLKEKEKCFYLIKNLNKSICILTKNLN